MRTNGVISSKQLSVWYYHNPHLQFRKANKDVYDFVTLSNWLFSCGPPSGRSMRLYFAYIPVNVHPHEQERHAMVCNTHRISYVPLALSLEKCVPMVSLVLSSYQSGIITLCHVEQLVVFMWSTSWAFDNLLLCIHPCQCAHTWAGKTGHGVYHTSDIICTFSVFAWKVRTNGVISSKQL